MVGMLSTGVSILHTFSKINKRNFSDQRRNVHIQVTQMRAPADLVRRSPDDDVSNLQRRVVLVRQPANQGANGQMKYETVV